MGLPLMLLSLIGGFAAGVLVLYAVITKRYTIANRIVSAGAIWLCVYAALLLLTSVTSDETVLSVNERKPFCGFYLDCHMGVAVVGAEKLTQLPSPEGAVDPKGIFYRVDCLTTFISPKADN